MWYVIVTAPPGGLHASWSTVHDAQAPGRSGLTLASV
jgi:hypothetical protein